MFFLQKSSNKANTSFQFLIPLTHIISIPVKLLFVVCDRGMTAGNEIFDELFNHIFPLYILTADNSIICYKNCNNPGKVSTSKNKH